MKFSSKLANSSLNIVVFKNRPNSPSRSSVQIELFLLAE